MRKANYTISDSTIANLLGRDSFATQQAAILELVKNAYDADAQKCDIEIKQNQIIISDNGRGMDFADIPQKWLDIGNSDKKDASSTANGRILSGSKGVGRFALARLGGQATLISQKKTEEGLLRGAIWETNWEESSYGSISDDWDNNKYGKLSGYPNPGTVIQVTNLYDSWTPRSIEAAKDLLSRNYFDSSMIICLVNSNGETEQILPRFSSYEIGQTHVTDIILHYDSEQMTLACEIDSDEFDNYTQAEDHEFSFHKYSSIIDLLEEINNSSSTEAKEIKKMSLSNQKEILHHLGNFSAHLFFGIGTSTTEEQKKFHYKYQSLPNQTIRNDKITLYRNAFAVPGLDGKKDWLGLDARARKSPAAASHPTGAWRVRGGQIAGFIVVDRDVNSNIKDLSNRQGVEENDSFLFLKTIVLQGIKCFEHYRQRIIRHFVSYVEPEINIEREYRRILKAITKKPSLIQSYLDNKESSEKLFAALQWSEKERICKENLQYDVHVLRAFASSGLQASANAHEINNERNNIEAIPDSVIETLKDYGYWDKLSLPEFAKTPDQNIPRLLDSAKSYNARILRLIDTLLHGTSKQHFKVKKLDVVNTLTSILNRWRANYVWVKFKLDTQIFSEVYFSEDIFDVIFNNLILNSIQMNPRNGNNLAISITVIQENTRLLFTYHDNGKGLSTKRFQDSPRLILEAQETSRSDGHGLGMWMLNNTVLEQHGQVTDIKGADGFTLKFYLESDLR